MTKNKNEPAFLHDLSIHICLARIRKGNGVRCITPPQTGKRRCFNHGGAPGSGAQLNNQNALKHGYTTKEIKSFKKSIRQALLNSNQIISKLADEKL